MDDHVRRQGSLLLTDIAAVRAGYLLHVRIAPFVFGKFLRRLADVFDFNVAVSFLFNVAVAERHFITVIVPLEPFRYKTKQNITICTKNI